MILPLPPPKQSWLQFFLSLSLAEQDKFIEQAGGLIDFHELSKTWRFIARREQLAPPGDWTVFVPLGGRGSGKTRAGAEWLIEQHRYSGARNSAIVGATAADLRDFCLEGISGILSIAPNEFRPKHYPSKRKVVWPNGTETHLYSAEEPNRLRGPNHDKAWADELASWQYLKDSWDNLEFTLRESDNPQIFVTTTPKPKKKFREILQDADTVKTVMSTFDNASNLSPKYLARMARKYGGTTLGKQELEAVLLEQAEGALWKRAWIENKRVKWEQIKERLTRIMIGVDPSVSNTKTSNETGITVAGTLENGQGVVLKDSSDQYSPFNWAKVAILAYFKLGAAYIVAEKNNGGDLVENNIRTTAHQLFAEGLIPSPHVAVCTVWAAKGKVARAEPIASLSEQGRILFCGEFEGLEDQLCNWTPNSGMDSPDRLDSFVWVMTKLMLGAGAEVNANESNVFMGESLSVVDEFGEAPRNFY